MAQTPTARGILVVEDDVEIRDALRDVLSDEGYAVATVSNGLEAIRYLHTEPAPGIVLLDLVMPIMDGWEFCLRRQNDPSLAALPVVVISGTDRYEQQDPLPDAVAYIEKPIDLPKLITLIETVGRFCG